MKKISLLFISISISILIVNCSLDYAMKRELKGINEKIGNNYIEANSKLFIEMTKNPEIIIFQFIQEDLPLFYTKLFEVFYQNIKKSFPNNNVMMSSNDNYKILLKNIHYETDLDNNIKYYDINHKKFNIIFQSKEYMILSNFLEKNKDKKFIFLPIFIKIAPVFHTIDRLKLFIEIDFIDGNKQEFLAQKRKIAYEEIILSKDLISDYNDDLYQPYFYAKLKNQLLESIDILNIQVKKQ